jgi:PAS domain S-box-containing protein
MAKTIFVATGEIAFGTSEDVLESTAIGSCVVMCAYDAQHTLGAMAHVMLSGAAPATETGLKTKYACDAVAAFLAGLSARGCDLSQIEVCLIGAANVLERQDDTTARNNLDSVLECLHQKHILIAAQSVGGTIRRSARIDVRSGTVFYRLGDDEERLLWSADTVGMKQWIEELEQARSERRHVEKKLVHSEALLKHVQQLSTLGGWQWDIKNDCMHWTDETYRIHGLEPGSLVPGSREYIEKSLACYRSEDHPVVLEAFQRCVKEGISYDLEFPFTAFDGRAKWIRTMAEAVRVDGEIVKVIGTLIDITGSKTAESTIKKLSQAVEHSPECIMITDRDGNIEYVNPKFVALTGYSSEEVLGKNPRFLQSGETPKEEYAQLWNAIAAGSEWRGVFRNKKKNGEVYWEEASISAVKNMAGEITHFVAVKEDITERKNMFDTIDKTEETFRALYENMPVGYQSLDKNGCILDVNKRWLELLGYARSDVIGRWFGDFLSGEDAAVFNERFQRFLAAKEVHGAEFDMVCKNGRLIHVAFDGQIAEDMTGAFTRTHCVCIDITERQKKEKLRCSHEASLQRRLDSILLTEGDPEMLQLADVLEAATAQSLMDDFYAITGFGIAIVDREGRVLVAAGWQDICTQFHRVHPETRKQCIESDTVLSRGVAAGECKLYKCKNNMWDMVTPIMLGERHIGNIFLGQFLFDDDTLDHDAFIHQAREFGFDENEYICALERVPRWSRQKVNAVMSFYSRLAGFIAELSLSKIMLAHDLTQRKQMEAALHESEERFLSVMYASSDAILLIDNNTFVDCNEATVKMLGYSSRAEINQTHPSRLSPPVQPDGRDSFEKADEMMRLAFEHGFHQFEWMHQRVSGEVFPVEVSLTPIIHKGKKILYCVWRDITDIKAADQALSRAYKNLRAIFLNAPFGVAIIDKSRNIRWVNQAVCQMAGFEHADEMIGRQCQDYFCPPGHDECPILDKRESVAYSEKVIYRKDGHVLPILKSVTEIDFDGEDVFLETFIDISERKKAEECLKESERQYRLLTDHAVSAIAVHEIISDESGMPVDYIFIAVNPAFEVHTQLKPEDVIGRRVTEILPGIEKGPFIKTYAEVVSSKKPISFEAYSEPLGRYFSINAYSLGEKRFATVFHDITTHKSVEQELKENTERLSLILFGGNLGTWEWDLVTGEVIFNDRWAEMLGYTREEITPHISSWEKLLHPDDMPLGRKKLDEHFTGKTDFYQADFRMRHKNGSWVWINDRGKVIERDSDGRALKASGTHLDITDRKAAEEKLEKKIAEIKSRNELMMGREERILDIKNEVNQLLLALGREKKYKTVSDD